MTGKVRNIKFCSPLNRSATELMTERNKLHHGLTGKYYATCHYSYNLPLYAILKLSQYLNIQGYFKLKNNENL